VSLAVKHRTVMRAASFTAQQLRSDDHLTSLSDVIYTRFRSTAADRTARAVAVMYGWAKSRCLS